MAAIKIRQLIDLAIGFPETGHVNFSALHCLLIHMAEKMNITDDTLNYDEIENEKCQESNKLLNGNFETQIYGMNNLRNQARLIAGLNPDDDDDRGNETPIEPSGEEERQQMEASQKELTKLRKGESSEGEEEAIETVIETMNVTNVEQESFSKLKDSHRQSDLTELPVETSNEHRNEFDIFEEKMPVPDNLLTGISVLRHQLEFVMEQLLLLTYFTLSKKPAAQHIQQLYTMAQTLNELKKENIPLKGLKQTPLSFVLSLDWVSSNLKLNDEDFAENVLPQVFITNASASTSHDTLEGHLCYSPAKLLDQLMDLKSEFCLVTNKLNELSARLLQQESHHLLALVQESHKQIRDIKLTHVEFRDNLSRLELRISNNQTSVESLKGSIEEISQKMVDKIHFETQLAQKADCNQLQGKASLDQFLELQCRIDKRFCEIFNRFNENDKKLLDTVENLKITLGPSALDEVLAKFKANISNDMQQLNALLENYIASTNDDCTAAGARVKVLQDLVCLSCDTNCVMPVREKAKVAKLPSAHASNIISPLVTYELGSIRKSGLMGYYRKDEFPHAPNAWLAQQSLALGNLNQSPPTRQAGGRHTTSSAKERLQKIMFNNE